MPETKREKKIKTNISEIQKRKNAPEMIIWSKYVTQTSLVQKSRREKGKYEQSTQVRHWDVTNTTMFVDKIEINKKIEIKLGNFNLIKLNNLIS